MTITARNQPLYRLRFGDRASRGGTYNSHLVLVVIVMVGSLLGLLDWYLSLFVLALFLMALALEERSLSRGFRLRSIPSQLVAYAELVFRLLVEDIARVYLVVFLLYVLAAPIYRRLDLQGGNSFWMLMAFFMFARIMAFVQYIYIIGWRWDGYDKPPFEVKKGNLGSRKEALWNILWSFFLGNIGTVVRCAPGVLVILLFEYLRGALGIRLESIPALEAYLLDLAVVSFLASMWYFKRVMVSGSYAFYRVHRSLHEYGGLYDAINKVHHRGVYPTLLDSGTISPLEFPLTEYLVPVFFVLPDWLFALARARLAFGNFEGHTNVKGHNFHVAHHKFFSVNFGADEHFDRRFGTLAEGS